MAAAKAEADRKRQDEGDAKAEAKRQRAEAIAAAKAEADRKKQEAAELKAEARRQRAEAIAAAKAEAEGKKQEAAELQAEARQQRAEAIAAAKLDRGGPSAQVREIGFRQLPGISRVFLRTSVPPQFTIQDVGENLIRVELENTRVARRNDARFLDTSFFASAVALISPSRHGSTYVVEIKLKQKVPYQQKIEGDMLAIDFERPAGGTAEGAPGDVPPVHGEPAPAPDR
jgi:hypothetical protein